MSEASDVGSTNTENKRIQYIDIAKTLGIILVIAGHIVSSDTEIKKVIYSFHMPLFFMLSGMLLKVKDQYNALTWRFNREKIEITYGSVCYMGFILRIFFRKASAVCFVWD